MWLLVHVHLLGAFIEVHDLYASTVAHTQPSLPFIYKKKLSPLPNKNPFPIRAMDGFLHVGVCEQESI